MVSIGILTYILGLADPIEDTGCICLLFFDIFLDFIVVIVLLLSDWRCGKLGCSLRRGQYAVVQCENML